MPDIKKLISRNIKTISPKDNLENASRIMQQYNCGILVVGNLIDPHGVITDRDIVIRAIAKGEDVKKSVVENYMTQEIYCCDEDGLTALKVLKRMEQGGVVRLLVKNNKKEICGIISLGDIIRNYLTTPSIFKKLEAILD